jgi:hypothetical protein
MHAFDTRECCQICCWACPLSTRMALTLARTPLRCRRQQQSLCHLKFTADGIWINKWPDAAQWGGLHQMLRLHSLLKLLVLIKAALRGSAVVWLHYHWLA